ncbi:MAG: hypothetical protein WC379_04180 [Methanoregula sp.]|jgi:hypothetical protein
MHDTGCPPFTDVLSLLFCIILSFAMILYLRIWISALQVQAIPLETWAFLFAFCAIIAYSSVRLAQGLFPERFRRCPACTLVRKIIEIDAVE